MDGKSSGFISGAASGAAAGSSFGPWGTAIGGVVGGVVGLFGGATNDAQFQSQQDWARYNAQSQYNVTAGNVSMQTMLTGFNIEMMRDSANDQARLAQEAGEYNADIIRMTSEYNSSLLDDDIDLIWEQNDLDLSQLHAVRERERGTLRAGIGASGTVLDIDSNKELVIFQKTQEELDAFIIRRGAENQVRESRNAQALGEWEAGVAIDQAIWNGNVAAYNTVESARNQSVSMGLTNLVNSSSTMQSASYQLSASNAGIAQSSDTYSNSNYQAMMTSLFSSAGRYGAEYYNNKSINVPTNGTLYSSASQTNYQRAVAGSPSWERGLSSPGSSLL